MHEIGNKFKIQNEINDQIVYIFIGLYNQGNKGEEGMKKTELLERLKEYKSEDNINMVLLNSIAELAHKNIICLADIKLKIFKYPMPPEKVKRIVNDEQTAIEWEKSQPEYEGKTMPSDKKLDNEIDYGEKE